MDPDGVYLVRWPSLTTVRFDADDLMMGEDIQNGAPVVVRQVDAAAIDSLVEGPLPVPA